MITLGASALTLYGLMVMALYTFQRRILFVPDKRRPDPAEGAAAGMTRVEAETADGLVLEGWWHPPPYNRPTVLYFQGNGGNIGMRDTKARRFIEHGYGVLLAGYRGYGGNPGSPSETGFLADGRAWLDALDTLGVLTEKTLVYGESLGTGVAVALGAEREDLGAVVLEAPFTSIRDIAAARYPFIPVRWLILDPFDSLKRVPRVVVPLLILHGDQDTLIPIDHGERLFAAAAQPKRIERIAGGGHTDLYDHGALAAVDHFLAVHGLVEARG
ncbi:MAG: alpha/beta hydrolase [Alphaproteobacteria bacterium]|nr:alpha/beta hydrolase [Alphaproteobacteria bacterium]